MEEEINVRIENNPSIPERTLGPITYVSWLLGVGIARPQNCPKWITVILRTIHFGICSVIVAYSAIDFANFGKEFTSKLFEIMYCMNETVSHLAAYYYVIHVLRHYDKWPELMKLIERLDENIGKELPINDKPVRIRQILAIVTVLLVGPVSLMVHILYYYFTAPDQIFASDLLLYYTIVRALTNSFVFDLLVYMICHRFRAINAIIKQLDESMGAYWISLKIRRIRKLHNGTYRILANSLPPTFSVSDVNETEHTSCRLKIDNELCSVVVAVNDIYGIDLLLCSTNAFIVVVAKLFRIYMSAAEQKSGFIFLNNVIWMIYGGQFIIMCWVSTLTHREINKIGLYISVFLLNTEHTTTKFNKLACFRSFHNKQPQQLGMFGNRYGDNVSLNLNDFRIESLLPSNFERDCVRDEMNDFSLELQQYRVAFTACDFFEVDNSLLTRFIGVITTYLIILVQFYKPEGI